MSVKKEETNHAYIKMTIKVYCAISSPSESENLAFLFQQPWNFTLWKDAYAIARAAF